MSTWYSASPYKAANMYIGGASRGCSQPNLTADWVTQTIAQGWTLIPTYVGLQASCSSATRTGSTRPRPPRRAPPPPTTRSPSSTRSAWASATRSTSTWRRSATPTPPACRRPATFLDQWTVRLHARGYVSGIYSSSHTLGAILLDSGAPSAAMHQPDDIWFARLERQPGDHRRRRRSRTSTGPTTSGSTSTRAATRRPGAASRSTSTTTRSTPPSPPRSWPPRAPSSRSPVAVSSTASPVARRST